MLDNLTDYKYVKGDIEELDIAGEIMPVRQNKRLIKGEDITWCQELLCDILSKTPLIGHGTAGTSPGMNKTLNGVYYPAVNSTKYYPEIDDNFNISNDFSKSFSALLINSLIDFTYEDPPLKRYINNYIFSLDNTVLQFPYVTSQGGDISSILDLTYPRQLYQNVEHIESSEPLALLKVQNLLNQFYLYQTWLSRDVLFYKQVAKYFKTNIITYGRDLTFSEMYNHYNINIERDTMHEAEEHIVLSVNSGKDLILRRFGQNPHNDVDKTAYTCEMQNNQILISIKCKEPDDIKHIYALFFVQYRIESHNYGGQGDVDINEQWNLWTDLKQFALYNGDYLYVTNSVQVQNHLKNCLINQCNVDWLDPATFCDGETKYGKLEFGGLYNLQILLYEVGILVAPRALLF